MSHVHLGVDKNAGMNWEPSWVTSDPTSSVGSLNMPLIIASPSGERVLEWPLFTGVSAEDLAALKAGGIGTVHTSEDVANALVAASQAALNPAGLAQAIVDRLPAGNVADAKAIAKAVRAELSENPLR